MATETVLLEEYVRLHNLGMTENDFSELLELFTDDAVLEFLGAVEMVLKGKAAIAQAFARMPPTSKIYAQKLVKGAEGTQLQYNSSGTSNGIEGSIRITSL